MERKIIGITTGEAVYTIDDTLTTGGQELRVKYISFRRDGLLGINKSGMNEAHYVVTVLNELNKQIFYIAIPERTVNTITFIEVNEKEDDSEVKVERVA